jgi:glycine cleavage system H protein
MVAIFVLTVFLSIILIDLIVLKVHGKNHPAFEPSIPQYDLTIFDGNSIAIPANIFFSKGHTWLKKNNNGLIEIGIDAFGTTALGRISILKCAKVDKELKRGEIIFEGSYGNKIIKFLSPINGIVKSVNSNIIGKEISSPYETWGVQLISEDFVKNRKLFLLGTDALSWMKKEFIKLKNFIDNHTSNVELAGVTMYDGGTKSNNIVSSLDEHSSSDFEKEFLSL